MSAIPSEKSVADSVLSYERPVRAEHQTYFPFVFKGQRIDDREAKDLVLSIVLPMSWDKSRSTECFVLCYGKPQLFAGVQSSHSNST